MTERLKDKVIVVTGGAGLIGQVYCRSVVKEGGRVVIAETNFAAAKKLADELSADGDKALACETDVTDEASLNSLLAVVQKKWGRCPEGVVNNAYPRNAGFGKDFWDVTYEVMQGNLSMHLGGYCLVSKVMAKAMKEAHVAGSIVNMASIYGVIPPRFSIYEGTKMANGPEYAMIKAGIIHLTQYTAQRLKQDNIRVNCISPGGIADGQPASFLQAYKDFCGSKGMLSPDDLAGTLTYLLSEDSRYVNGQNIVVDDGFSL